MAQENNELQEELIHLLSDNEGFQNEIMQALKSSVVKRELGDTAYNQLAKSLEEIEKQSGKKEAEEGESANDSELPEDPVDWLKTFYPLWQSMKEIPQLVQAPNLKLGEKLKFRFNKRKSEEIPMAKTFETNDNVYRHMLQFLHLQDLNNFIEAWTDELWIKTSINFRGMNFLDQLEEENRDRVKIMMEKSSLRPRERFENVRCTGIWAPYIQQVAHQVTGKPEKFILVAETVSIINDMVSQTMYDLVDVTRTLPFAKVEHVTSVDELELGDDSAEMTVDSRQVLDAIRILFPGELAKHGVSEGCKAVTRCNRIEPGSFSYLSWESFKNSKAGLCFGVDLTVACVALSRRVTRSEAWYSAHGITQEGATYLAGVLEYIVAEVLELALGEAEQANSDFILPIHVHRAIEKDDQLRKLLPGIIPHASPSSISTTTEMIPLSCGGITHGHSSSSPILSFSSSFCKKFTQDFKTDTSVSPIARQALSIAADDLATRLFKLSKKISATSSATASSSDADCECSLDQLRLAKELLFQDRK